MYLSRTRASIDRRAVIVVLAAVLSLQHTMGAGTTALFEPVDGNVYFGFTFRYWDGPTLSDPKYGDTRPFDQRYGDAIQVELGSKAPSIFGVPTIWQNADGSMVPFGDTASIIAKTRSVSAEGVPGEIGRAYV